MDVRKVVGGSSGNLGQRYDHWKKLLLLEAGMGELDSSGMGDLPLQLCLGLRYTHTRLLGIIS